MPDIKESQMTLIASKQKALAAVVMGLYFDDEHDFRTTLLSVVYFLGGDEALKLTEDNPSSAYQKYVVSPSETSNE